MTQDGREQNSKASINRQRLLDKRGLPDLPQARAQLAAALAAREDLSSASVAALAEVPRHAFAPPLLWRMAYLDIELWGPVSFLPRPSVVGIIATAVDRSNARRILEYATGTGYATAVLSMLAERVDTVEHDPWQLWMSSDAFRELEILHISQKASDGILGWPERAPYDAIVVCAAMPRIPRILMNQLVEGGTIIAPIGPYFGPHRLLEAVKSVGDSVISDLGPCYFPPLTGVWGPPYLGGGDLEPGPDQVSSIEDEAAARGASRGIALG